MLLGNHLHGCKVTWCNKAVCFRVFLPTWAQPSTIHHLSHILSCEYDTGGERGRGGGKLERSACDVLGKKKLRLSQTAVSQQPSLCLHYVAETIRSHTRNGRDTRWDRSFPDCPLAADDSLCLDLWVRPPEVHD